MKGKKKQKKTPKFNLIHSLCPQVEDSSLNSALFVFLIIFVYFYFQSIY